MSRTWSRAETGAFTSLGSLDLPGLCGIGTVRSLRRAVARLAPNPAHARLGRAYAVRDLLRRSPLIAGWAVEMSRSAWVRGALGETLGEAVVPISALLFDKTPHANWRVPWHQDVMVPLRERIDVPGWGAWSLKDQVVHALPPADVLARRVAVRLLLDDCRPGDGPLMVLPGSHLRGQLEDKEIDEAVSTIAPVALIGSAGDATLIHPLLLHASKPMEIPCRRRVLHVEFAPRLLAAGLAWQEPRVASRR